MKPVLVRLTAAVIAGSDDRTAEYLLEQLDSDTREDVRRAAQSLAETVDLDAWRETMTPKTVVLLREACGLDVNGADMPEPEPEPSPFADLGLGSRSIESLGRLLEENAVPEGAA